MINGMYNKKVRQKKSWNRMMDMIDFIKTAICFGCKSYTFLGFYPARYFVHGALKGILCLAKIN